MIAGAAAHLRYKKRPSPKSNSRTKRPIKNFMSTSRHDSLLSLLPVYSTTQSTSTSTSTNNSSNSPSKIQNSLLISKNRSGSVPILKFTLALAWNLKIDHVRALKITWTRLCDFPRSNCRGILGIVEKAFDKFESKEKSLKDIFYRSAFVDSMADCTEHRRRNSDDGSIASIATLRDHQHFVVSIISQVVQSLEKSPQKIFEHIDRIGCYHSHLKKFGFQAQMWDRLGACLLDGLVVQECLRGFPDACRAWTILIAALIDRLRSAPRHIPSAKINNNSSAVKEETTQLPTSTNSYHRRRAPSTMLDCYKLAPNSKNSTLRAGSLTNTPMEEPMSTKMNNNNNNNNSSLKDVSCLHFEKMLELSNSDEIAMEFCQQKLPIQTANYENVTTITQNQPNFLSFNNYNKQMLQQQQEQQQNNFCPHFQKLLIGVDNSLSKQNLNENCCQQQQQQQNLPKLQQQNINDSQINRRYSEQQSPRNFASKQQCFEAKFQQQQDFEETQQQQQQQRRKSELLPQQRTNQLKNILSKLQLQKQQLMQQPQQNQQQQQQQQIPKENIKKLPQQFIIKNSGDLEDLLPTESTTTATNALHKNLSASNYQDFQKLSINSINNCRQRSKSQQRLLETYFGSNDKNSKNFRIKNTPFL